MKRVLVAGVGNIFLGDDGFGVELARALCCRGLPPEVQVTDFGIRSYDLACALAEGYEAVILLDALPQGRPAGTLAILEPDLAGLEQPGRMPLDGHSLNPVSVLQMAQAMGSVPARLYLVGCEPQDLGGDEGRLGLSEVVQGALAQAVEMVEGLVGDLLRLEMPTTTGICPV